MSRNLKRRVPGANRKRVENINSFTMQKFLSFKYYFTPYPDPAFHWTKLTLLIGVLLILGGMGLAFYRKRLSDPVMKKLLRPYSGQLQTYGVLTLFLLVSREAGIPYLSMRFWWILLGAFFLYSFFRFLFRFRSDYQRKKEALQMRESRSKYLPKKKR